MVANPAEGVRGQAVMHFDGVIFDLDGTLLDTLSDITASLNHVLTDRNLPTVEIDTCRKLVGSGVAMLVTRALPEGARGEKTVEELVEAFRLVYGRNWNVCTRPYEGIPALLDGLSGRGIKLSVLSNKPDDFTRRCVTGLLAEWKFAVVLGQREGVPNKPDPGGALEIARRLRLPPSRVLFVGDSGIDMLTARRAEMTAAGVLWGFRSRRELEESGATVVVERPEEILRLLDN